MNAMQWMAGQIVGRSFRKLHPQVARSQAQKDEIKRYALRPEGCTAFEAAEHCGIAVSTARGHLSALAAAGMLSVDMSRCSKGFPARYFSAREGK